LSSGRASNALSSEGKLEPLCAPDVVFRGEAPLRFEWSSLIGADRGEWGFGSIGIVACSTIFSCRIPST
jgi:hypothetical protein